MVVVRKILMDVEKELPIVVDTYTHKEDIPPLVTEADKTENKKTTSDIPAKGRYY